MATNDEPNNDEREHKRKVVRRRAMKAGAILVPTIVTLRGRTVWAAVTNKTGKQYTP